MNCGIDGSPVLEILDATEFSTSYIKKFCMNVKGARDFEIGFYSLEQASPPNHVEVESHALLTSHGKRKTLNVKRTNAKRYTLNDKR